MFSNMLVGPTICCIFFSFFLSWCHILIIQNLPTAFLILGLIFIFQTYQDMNFNQSNHATFKMGKCESGHTSTSMLDKNANLPSRMLPPPPTPHRSVWPSRCLKYLQKLFSISMNSTCFASLKQPTRGSVP